ncbi:glycine receptor subunit alphaZ1-like [Orbicella faveolata]|uniref:glycine receptor subunit alphaZ1-like n=1 Tax=Orbicella faveolata TaxID=48498 RepID=UPI0009E20B2E|nr:glycine receptor subunit alphaZ1-like [Orbicella faveolata]
MTVRFDLQTELSEMKAALAFPILAAILLSEPPSLLIILPREIAAARFLTMAVAGIFTFFSLLLLMIFFDTAASKHHQSNLTMTERLDSLFTKPRYDPRLRPFFNVKPVTITVGIWIVAMDAINVMDMEYGLDIFLRQSWTDPRLDHGLRGTLSLSNTIVSQIWLPDSYFKNAKDASFHDVTTPNMMITIGPGGLVNYNARVTLKASCPMDLRLYPMDVQHCPLIIESYGYDINNIAYKWEMSSDDGMSFVPSDMKMLPQFKLTKLQLSTLCTSYVVGNWSGVKALFTLQRLYSFQVIHLYGPSALIVTLSWLTFLLPRSQSPARVTLGVTSVLTIVTILTMSNNAMPKVNYVKAIDKYLIVCFLFVFCSLLEYAIVLLLDRGKRKFEKEKNEFNGHTTKQNGTTKQRQSTMSLEEKRLHEELMNGNTNSTSHKHERTRNYSDGNVSLHVSMSETQINWAEKRHSVREFIYCETFIVGVDELSLKLFSVVFTTFNLYYWLTIFYFSDSVI